MENGNTGPGRPEIEISFLELEVLGELGCTNKEMAAYFGVSERLIEMRRTKEEFRQSIERGISKGNISLRRKQYEMALAGDKTMLIWLGKQRLGQSNMPGDEDEIEGGGLPATINVNFIKPKRRDDAGERVKPENA